VQAPLWWGIWLQHGTRLSTFQQLTTTRPTSTSASSILDHVATWNWYSNLTIDGSIYVVSLRAFCIWRGLCMSGRKLMDPPTYIYIYIYIYRLSNLPPEEDTLRYVLTRKPDGLHIRSGCTRNEVILCPFLDSNYGSSNRNLTTLLPEPSLHPAASCSVTNSFFYACKFWFYKPWRHQKNKGGLHMKLNVLHCTCVTMTSKNAVIESCSEMRSGNDFVALKWTLLLIIHFDDANKQNISLLLYFNAAISQGLVNGVE